MTKGRIPTYPPAIVQSMREGDVAYLLASSVIVTPNAIFIDRIAEIAYEVDGDTPDSNMVRIERFGPGYEDKDFELDFTETKSIFKVETEEFAQCLKREGKDTYLMLTHFGFESVPDKEGTARLYNDKSTEELQALMDKYVALDDFLTAAIYRDRINLRKAQVQQTKEENQKRP